MAGNPGLADLAISALSRCQASQNRLPEVAGTPLRSPHRGRRWRGRQRFGLLGFIRRAHGVLLLVCRAMVGPRGANGLPPWGLGQSASIIRQPSRLGHGDSITGRGANGVMPRRQRMPAVRAGAPHLLGICSSADMPRELPRHGLPQSG